MATTNAGGTGGATGGTGGTGGGTTKRARSTRQGDRFQVWRKVAASAAANAADLPQVAITLGSLEKVIADADKVVLDQGAFQASKQMASQRLQALLDQGDKLTTVLKTIIKQHYGSGSDKLVEFGIQPFRVRPKATVVPPPPAPEVGAPSPTTTTPITTTTTTTPTTIPPSTK
jgi:uncharacterized protein (DUF1778 family)